MAFANTIPLIY